jgi:hypothetical protein
VQKRFLNQFLQIMIGYVERKSNYLLKLRNTKMSDEKSNNPPPAHKNQDKTAGKPVSPKNQPSTRDAKPISPLNALITNATGHKGNTGKPTSPPNPDITKGGGK